MKSNPLSDRLIQKGKIPFKLWLEFEVPGPWHEIDNDFANISVDTLDGRRYCINIWTYKFLESVTEQDKKDGEHLGGLYQVPPDLFIKELSRECIERVIADLLENGSLEDNLNKSIFELQFLEPYWDAFQMEEKSVQALMNELKLELPDNHLLQNENAEIIARKTTNDDIVLELENGSIAVVHLTWSSLKEVDGYPITRIYKDKIEFWNKEMRLDILDSQE